MKIIISGKNIEVSEGLKERTLKKLGKLNKFFKKDTEAHVTFSLEKNRQIQIIEVTIPYNNIVFRAEEEGNDMYHAIDKVIDIIERQILKNKTRLEKKLKKSAYEPENFSIEEDIEEETEFNIVKVKRFDIKPMSVEEAILQMNLLGHAFFVFTNSENDETNVVYKRRDGNYGLIDPAI